MKASTRHTVSYWLNGANTPSPASCLEIVQREGAFTPIAPPPHAYKKSIQYLPLDWWNQELPQSVLVQLVDPDVGHLS